MNKTIKDLFEVYKPKAPDEQKFVDKHVVIKHKDRNGNGDDVFNASDKKKIDRKKNRLGYDPTEDEQVYEETEELDEKTLTPAELKKREEIAKAMEREKPGMNKSKKMAIATAAAKRVAEAYEDDDGWYAHREMMGNKGVSKEDWKKGYRMNLKGEKIMSKPKQMSNEEVEDLDETSAKKAMDYLSKSFAPREAAAERSGKATRYNPGDRKEADRLLGNKMKGAERARKVISKSFSVKEESEQIDEISKKLASSYLQKKHERDYDTSADGTTSSSKKPKTFTQMNKDVKYGVKAANVIMKKSLTKEDIINNALDKYLPQVSEYEPLSNEELIISKLENISESHIYMILELYQSLSPDNQSKLFSQLDSEDGIKTVLDFAIENRGL